MDVLGKVWTNVSVKEILATVWRNVGKFQGNNKISKTLQSIRVTHCILKYCGNFGKLSEKF